MSLDRRSFLVRTGLVLTVDALAAARAQRASGQASAPAAPQLSWSRVRREFALAGDYVHLAGLLLASHPRAVRDAIDRHRRGLDANPVHYLEEHRWELEARVLAAAADYLGADPREIALTDSTTMGLGTLYTGLELRPDQEIVCTTHDHYSTRESIRLRAARTGASAREISLYRDLAVVTPGEIVQSVLAAVTPRTRVVAVTWVHSSTGLKLPVRMIADALARVNADREPADRVLLSVDGVHAFGVEDVTMSDLGCDFLVAGCHKWLLGPRGTGIVWGREEAWRAATPTIPSFSGRHSPGSAMTPGGFHSFEHRWALAEAFEFQLRVGKARVAERITALAGRLKEGLSKIAGVVVHTPLSRELSAGLVCFELAGRDPDDVAEQLRERKVIASVAPYASRYLRFSPGIFTSERDVERALAAVRAVAGTSTSAPPAP